MGMIAKTVTKGFRPCIFRNQPVHQFFGHLQSVMQALSPSGEMEHLFAKPNVMGGDQGPNSEIEWTTDLKGDPVRLHDLPTAKQQHLVQIVASSLEKIRAYAEARKGKTGIEKDYAEYLESIALAPDLNQIFSIQNRPVIIHWGFVAEESGNFGKKMFAGWDDFISQIQRKTLPQDSPTPDTSFLPPEPPKVEDKTATAQLTSPQKPASEKVAQKKEPPSEKPIVACGLGDYQWVKWLAIVLAVVILLLLLLRLLPPMSPRSQSQLPALSSRNDASGGFFGSGGGGANLGSPGNGSSKSVGMPAPGQICPTCGETKPTSSHGSTQANANNPSIEAQSSIASSESKTASESAQTSKESLETEFSVSIQTISNQQHELLSEPKDPKTLWEIVDTKGNPVISTEAYFNNIPKNHSAKGTSVTLHLPPPGKAFDCVVIAKNSRGDKTKYHFVSKE
ncbi:MAG: hypothetical protein HQM08_21160 [Candidatus Riflebacteria bacterium]|nr:hypothetical protein [Candidatus Riflebacteria bacterium]